MGSMCTIAGTQCMLMACLLFCAVTARTPGLTRRGSPSRSISASRDPPATISVPEAAPPSNSSSWRRLPPAPFAVVNAPGDGSLGPTTTRASQAVPTNPADPPGLQGIIWTNQTLASVSPGELLPVAQANSPLSTWWQALVLLGPLSPLADPQLVATLFIPSDQAWQAWLSERGARQLSDVPLNELAAAVNQAIAPGVALRRASLKEGVMLASAAGTLITIGPQLQVLVDVAAGIHAAITEPNLQAGYAVAHVIDAVLPPAKTAAAVQESSGLLQVFESAAAALQSQDNAAGLFLDIAVAAGLEDMLMDGHAANTWVVPSNKALAAVLGPGAANDLQALPADLAEAFVTSHLVNSAAIDLTAMLTRLGGTLSMMQNLTLAVALKKGGPGAYTVESGSLQPSALMDSSKASQGTSVVHATLSDTQDMLNRNYTAARDALASGSAHLTIGSKQVLQAGIVGGKSVVYVIDGQLAGPKVAADMQAAAAQQPTAPLRGPAAATTSGGSSSSNGTARSAAFLHGVNCQQTVLAVAMGVAVVLL